MRMNTINFLQEHIIKSVHVTEPEEDQKEDGYITSKILLTNSVYGSRGDTSGLGAKTKAPAPTLDANVHQYYYYPPGAYNKH